MRWNYRGRQKDGSKSWTYKTDEGRIEANLSENGNLTINFPNERRDILSQTEATDYQALRNMGAVKLFFRQFFGVENPKTKAHGYHPGFETGPENSWEKYGDVLAELPKEVKERICVDVSEGLRFRTRQTASDYEVVSANAHLWPKEADAIVGEPQTKEECVLWLLGGSGSSIEEEKIGIYSSKGEFLESFSKNDYLLSRVFSKSLSSEEILGEKEIRLKERLAWGAATRLILCLGAVSVGALGTYFGLRDEIDKNSQNKYEITSEYFDGAVDKVTTKSDWRGRAKLEDFQEVPKRTIGR